MTSVVDTQVNRKKRHLRVRKKVSGTTMRPRLCVFRSLKYIYAQIMDDTTGNTLVSASSLVSELKDSTKTKTENASQVGELLAKRAIELNIDQVVFDRNGYKYHGRVKALAEAVREAGLKF